MFQTEETELPAIGSSTQTYNGQGWVKVGFQNSNQA